MVHTETKVFTAHAPLPLAEKVDQLATWLERSRGWIVKQALAAWIDQEDERSRLTREALEDVSAGRAIDHQSVQAWADRLNTDQPLPAPFLVYSVATCSSISPKPKHHRTVLLRIYSQARTGSSNMMPCMPAPCAVGASPSHEI